MEVLHNAIAQLSASLNSGLRDYVTISSEMVLSLHGALTLLGHVLFAGRSIKGVFSPASTEAASIGSLVAVAVLVLVLLPAGDDASQTLENGLLFDVHSHVYYGMSERGTSMNVRQLTQLSECCTSWSGSLSTARSAVERLSSDGSGSGGGSLASNRMV
jgi:hypothetical protein